MKQKFGDEAQDCKKKFKWITGVKLILCQAIKKSKLSFR